MRAQAPDRPVRRTHVNPCRWTAWWNPDYFERACGGQVGLQPRRQRVAVLNLVADRVYDNVVENVHFLSGAGLADVTPEVMARIADKRGLHGDDVGMPSRNYILDIEQLLTGLESAGTYTTLFEVIAKGRIDSIVEKAWLSLLVIEHWFRTPLAIGAFERATDSCELERVEALMHLRQLYLEPPPFVASSASALTRSQWIVYRTDEHAFPLSDAAFLVNPRSILFPCSPRMLIEIHRRQRLPSLGIVHKGAPPRGKLREYRTRCLERTSKEVIFHDRDVLEEWRRSPEGRRRIAQLKSSGRGLRASA